MSRTRSLTLAALLAALTALCSQLALPTPWGVPINLATLTVFLAGSLLGTVWGGAAIGTYLLLGLCGVPVFAGMRGGLDALAGPTGGYLVGFLAAALLIGLLRDRMPLPLAMACGLAACYAFGTAWFMVLSGNGLAHSLLLCVLPYLPGDAVKIIAATLLCRRLQPALHAA